MPKSEKPQQKPYSRRRHIIQSFEAKAESQRTLPEKLADEATNRLGTVAFLVFNILVFAVWIAMNTGMVPGMPTFDPFPFSLLTMIVSLEAIVLSIIVLISQNREAKTAMLREEIDLQINTIAEEEITKILRMLKAVMEKAGIDTSRDEELKRMLKPADTKKIEQTIERQVNGNK